MTVPPFFFVLDVESVGLHGQPFAVGWVVIETATWEPVSDGMLVSSFPIACREATPPDITWVSDNVLPALGEFDARHGGALRKMFWNEWTAWEQHGAMMAADVPWPVEARFLMQCARYTFWQWGNDPDGGDKQIGPRIQRGPYPLIDIASVRLAKGFDPIATCARLPNELPAHNPLNDARQSARLLAEALRS